MNSLKIEWQTTQDLLNQLRELADAMEAKPVEKPAAQPEGEFPECDDPLLPDALRLVVDTGEVSITTIKDGLRGIGYMRAAHLHETIQDGTKWDQFLAGMWLDKLNGGK